MNRPAIEQALLSLACIGLLAMSADNQSFTNRKDWNVTLTGLEHKYLVSHPAAADQADFDALSAVILQTEVPYDLRVKSAILLARICRQSLESVPFCTSVLSSLKAPEMAGRENIQLATYIQNISSWQLPTRPDLEPATAGPASTSAPSVDAVSETAPPPAPSHYHWMLLTQFLVGLILGGLVMMGMGFFRGTAKAKAIQTALVVDDDPMTLLVMKKLLSGLGIHTETFLDPREALRRYATQEFDLVVLDYMMPEMNGRELAETMVHVQKSQPDVVFYTGKVERVLEGISNMPVKVSQVIQKSDDLQSIRKIFEKVLERAHA